MYRLHKEGIAYVIASVLLMLVGAAVYLYAHSIVGSIIIALAVFLLIFSLQFFRNPKRTIPSADNTQVYCPADGKVVVIEETSEPEYFKDRRIQISVFMNPLNVHVNRSAIGGEITYKKYHKGKYLVAWHPKSSTENERSTTVISNGKHEVLLRQIAGAVARRIRNYVEPGHKVNQGEEFGFIKFGSRVDIFLPLGSDVKVKIDDIVRGNKDILARLP